MISALSVLLLVTSCHQPEFIESTADRQGLTSLTAIFTSGPYVDKELAKLIVDDPEQDRFVIPVPWYFPSSSDDQTTIYMTRVRVQAELQPNYTIYPPLGILDLTEENEFTFTNPKGVSRRIVITGQRVKSSECQIMSFTLSNPDVAGVVDPDNRTVVLPTKDDVTKATASVLVSPHATIFPDPAKARDYTNPVKFTVTAHDGKTTAEYTVQTGEPEKIDMGVNFNTMKQAFNIDPVSFLGLSPYDALAYISLASTQDRLLVYEGLGNDPLIVNAVTGVKEGNYSLGGFPAGAITNDDCGHMVFVNTAQGGAVAETVTIAMASSLSESPKQLFSFLNPASEPVGRRIKVMGDITSNAVVTLTCEGVEGVTTTAKAVYAIVEGGAVSSVDVLDFASVTGGWGPAPVNIATVVPASLNPSADGWFYDYYEGNADESGTYLLHYYKNGKDEIAARIGDWSNNPNCLDTKCFNNARFMSLLVVSHFPQWGIGPRLYICDITDPEIKGADFADENIKWSQIGAAGVASGDVVMAPSSDGYMLRIFYYDHNSQAVGAYVVDCIKR